MNFALLIDKSNNHKKIVAEMEKYFDIKFHIISPIYATTIDDKDNCIISVTPMKIHFMFFETGDEEVKNNMFLKIKKFMCEYFRRQVVGIANYKNKDELIFGDIKEVTTIYI